MSNGPEPHNSCKSCSYWHQGVRVSHNHCDNPVSRYYDSMHSRANGRSDIAIFINYKQTKLSLCHYHSNPDKRYFYDLEWMNYWYQYWKNKSRVEPHSILIDWLNKTPEEIQ